MDNLNLVSLNVNGMRSLLKRRAIFNVLRKNANGIIFLQETHFTPSEEKICLAEWGGPGYFSHGKSNARGLGILFPRNFNPRIESTITDEEGRLLILQIKQGDKFITLANVYAPTQNDARDLDRFLSKVDESLAALEVHTLLLGGDLNIDLDRHDKNQGRNSSFIQVYAAKIRTFMEDCT